MTETLGVLRLVAAIGAGLVGGLLLAFSTAVMPALGTLPPAQGALAMQRMNSAILNPLFGLLFLGSTLACLAVLVGTPLAGGPVLPVIGALLYVLGVIALTFGVNVPMNNALDRLDPGAADTEAYWRRYLARWTGANHVRVLAATAAAALLLAG